MNLKLDDGIDLLSKESLSKDHDAKILENYDVLYREGSKVKHIYIVHTGKIGLFKKSKGRILLIDIMEEGDFLGETHLFNNSKKTEFSAVALGPSEVLKVNIGEMKKVLTNCPDWVNDLFKTISSRLISSLELLEEHQINDERINKKIPLSKKVQDIIKKNIDSVK